MNKSVTKFILALSACLATGFVIAGTWNNTYPIVGGASFSCGSVNAVSNCTIAAGPTALTGSETIPADTNLSGGRNPQTVQVPVLQLGAGLTTYNVPVTGDSVTITNLTRQLMINPAGTIANFTIVFPAATTLTAAANQRFGFCTTQIVSTLTLTAGSGTTITNGPTAMLVPVATGAASCVEWIYQLSSTTWFRTQ